MRTLAKLCTVIGILALGYCAYEMINARLYQGREAAQFVPGRTVVPRPRPLAGSAVAKLEIPRLSMSVVVIEGAGEAELKLGAGHIQETSLPGEGGNVGVAGHRDTFFRPLKSIHLDDTIKVTTNGHEYLYKVVSTRIVSPRDTQVLRPAGHETLTLVTCYPFNFIGPAPQRFIVQADCLDCARHV